MISKYHSLGLRLLAIAALALAAGCSATITPPEGVREPVSVWLLDHGRHSSLVLWGEGGYVRYAYGDWRWYALRETGPSDGLRALFAPTQAALGRQALGGLVSAASLQRGLAVGIEHLHEIRVEASASKALLGRLNEMHEREGAERVWNRDFMLEFAAHPEPYHLFNQSNAKVALWLESLGCKVSGKPLLADWEVGRGSK